MKVPVLRHTLALALITPAVLAPAAVSAQETREFEAVLAEAEKSALAVLEMESAFEERIAAEIEEAIEKKIQAYQIEAARRARMSQRLNDERNPTASSASNGCETTIDSPGRNRFATLAEAKGDECSERFAVKTRTIRRQPGLRELNYHSIRQGYAGRNYYRGHI